MKDELKHIVRSKIGAIKNNVSTKLQDSKRIAACYLNENINRLSSTHKKVSLIIFGLIVVAVCASMVVTSMNDAVDSISIDQITLPKDIYPSDDYKKGIKKILRIKTILDSLRKSPQGLTVYDSLINARPGLMDSFHLLMRNYKLNYSH